MMILRPYHPPHMEVDESKSQDGCLYLDHHFEGKPLVKEFIHNTMLGIGYLWGGPVKLETAELAEEEREAIPTSAYYARFLRKRSPPHQRVV
jgi:stage V sporulation protein R